MYTSGAFFHNHLLGFYGFNCCIMNLQIQAMIEYPKHLILKNFYAISIYFLNKLIVLKSSPESSGVDSVAAFNGLFSGNTSIEKNIVTITTDTFRSKEGKA